MASSLALRRLFSSTVAPRVLLAVRQTAPSRLFNTNAVSRYDDDEDERGIKVDRRSSRPVTSHRDDFLSGAFDPFAPTRSMSQILNFMNQLVEDPLLAATRGVGASGLRRGWDVREADEALHLRIDMPGLGKDDVKLTLEQSTLVIKGEGKEDKDEIDGEDGNGGGSRRYTSRIDLPEKIYRADQIKAEMKNGVLKVVIPKVKEEERRDVRQIQVN